MGGDHSSIEVGHGQTCTAHQLRKG